MSFASSTKNPHTILTQFYNYPSFRPFQEAALSLFLKNESILAILPTGSGKSLIFQIAGQFVDGAVLIITPLISLMSDQKKELDLLKNRSHGFDQFSDLNFSSSFVNSSLTQTERELRLQKFRKKAFKFFFITPERFQKKNFLEILKEISIDLIVIDEAHCISAWGHDFRPDYKKLTHYIKLVHNSKNESPPIMALTATSGNEVSNDIIKTLSISSENVLRGEVERKNIFLQVLHVYGENDKAKYLLKILSQNKGSTIVYFSLISTLKRALELMNLHGITPHVYHGDLSKTVREKEQKSFMDNDECIMFATNAFGLGINKPNIRNIIHWEIPGTLEAYIQEAGRAGRDGLKSLAILLFDPDDLYIRKEFNTALNPPLSLYQSILSELNKGEQFTHVLKDRFSLFKRDSRVENALQILEQLGQVYSYKERTVYKLSPECSWTEEIATYLHEKRKWAERGLDYIEKYANACSCRTELINTYFDISSDPKCSHCDSCQSAPISFTLTDELPLSPILEQKTSPIRSSSAEFIIMKTNTFLPFSELPPNQIFLNRWIDINEMGMGMIERVLSGGKIIIFQRCSDLKSIKLNLEDKKIKLL